MPYVLKTLASGLEDKIRMQRKVRSAMVYPLVIISVSILVVFMLFIFVVPRFESLYQDMMPGQSLPFLTVTFIGLGHHFQAQWGLYLGIGLCAFIISRFLGKVHAIRLFWDRFFIQIPLIGNMKKKLFSAQFSSSLALLLTSGVSLLNALKLAQNGFSNRYYKDELSLVCGKVQEGKSLHQSLAESSLFPEMLLSMIEVGSKEGASQS